MSDAIKVGVILFTIYGVWLYNRRALGAATLSLAPITWLTIFLVTALTKSYIFNNAVVSGYAHEAAWVSMNDNPHPENWEVNYGGEYVPFLVAIIVPILAAIILRVFNGWVFRNFLALGLIGWFILLVFAGDGFAPNKKKYYGTLPPIGSPARTSVY